MKDTSSEYLPLDRPSFLDVVRDRTQVELQRCYQCTRCASGCPIVEAMDYAPNQIIKMVQLGLKDAVLGSATIWLCAGCETCTVRCPMQLDVARVMDGLRELAIAEGVAGPERRIPVFHRTFLADVKERGRVHELAQLLRYKVEAGDLLSDIGLGLRLLAKGRLALKPGRVDRMDQMQALFEVTKVESA